MSVKCRKICQETKQQLINNIFCILEKNLCMCVKFNVQFSKNNTLDNKSYCTVSSGKFSSTNTTQTSGGLFLTGSFFFNISTNSLFFKQPWTNSLSSTLPSLFTSRYWKISVAFSFEALFNKEKYYFDFLELCNSILTFPTPSSSSKQVIILTISFSSIDPEKIVFKNENSIIQNFSRIYLNHPYQKF